MRSDMGSPGLVLCVQKESVAWSRILPRLPRVFPAFNRHGCAAFSRHRRRKGRGRRTLTGKGARKEPEKNVGFVQIHAEVLRRSKNAVTENEKISADAFQTKAGTRFAKLQNGVGK